MVDVERGEDDYGFEWITVKSPKAEVTYLISKSENGFSQYQVSLSSGKVPPELSGVYTTPDFALRCVLKHIEKKRWTQAAKNRETAKRVAQRKKEREDGKLQSNSSDTVQ
jgi:hypothetical protein